MISTSVIIPFHRNLDHLTQCVSSLHPLPSHTELVIAADGAIEDCGPLAAQYGARIVVVPGPSGPAAARNKAAATCRSELLIFIDADVVVSSFSLRAMIGEFSLHPEMVGLFGTYDDKPAAANFFSQYKNLTHAYVHQSSNREARTFWAGFGGMRATVFRSMGGFDERFTRPSIEDIEFGDRVTAAGYQICVDGRLQGCHLKKWTFQSMVASDVWDRGIPWTQLILNSGRFHDALNVTVRSRLSVMLCYMALAFLVLAGQRPMMLFPALALILITLFLNRRQYLYFSSRRGSWFAIRAMPVHLLYHLYNGCSFLAGGVLHLCDRYLGIRMPGTIPAGGWQGGLRLIGAIHPQLEGRLSTVIVPKIPDTELVFPRGDATGEHFLTRANATALARQRRHDERIVVSPKLQVDVMRARPGKKHP
jgi:glycosyltransferase involved in cell wall biosynthesis